MRREVEIDRFRARTESGTEYTIIEYQTYISSQTFGNPNSEVLGLKKLVTTTGLCVNYINPHTFKIASTGEILRKV